MTLIESCNDDCRTCSKVTGTASFSVIAQVKDTLRQGGKEGISRCRSAGKQLAYRMNRVTWTRQKHLNTLPCHSQTEFQCDVCFRRRTEIQFVGIMVIYNTLIQSRPSYTQTNSSIVWTSHRDQAGRDMETVVLYILWSRLSGQIKDN